MPFSADLQVKEVGQRRAARTPHLCGSQIDHSLNLDLQRERGANLLLTPGRALDSGNPGDALNTLCDDADEAQSRIGAGERLALNVTISDRWLKARDLRDQLLAELLDRDDFDIWYVLVQLPFLSTRNHSQVADSETLLGLKYLCELAENEERKLLLPSTSFAGWCMTGLGATGFGTSTSTSLQLFKAYVEQRGGRPRTINRYFERQLIHVVEESARPGLVADGAYAQCDCRYCQSLLSSPTWDWRLSNLHQVFCAARMTAEVGATGAGRGGRRGTVRRRVEAALDFARGKGLTDANSPRHLTSWRGIL